MSAECSSDWVLVSQFAQGSSEGFEEILSRYEGELFHLCAVLTRSAEEAEETLGAVFCDAYRELPTLLDSEERAARPSLRAWLYTRTVERALALREEEDLSKAVETVIVTDASAEELSTGDLSPELKLEVVLRRLPLEYRLVYLLRQIAGHSVEHCAAFLRISPLEVRAYLHRARLMVIRAFRRSTPVSELAAEIAVELEAAPSCRLLV